MSPPIDRREFLRLLGLAGTLPLTGCVLPYSSRVGRRRPNIILCMADDQGWGDVGYMGHEILQTPNLDRMAGAGLRFDRWYAAAPVCSPTRGSCLTGRHPHRYGILHANVGHMRSTESTLAEALRSLGYRTGHFGKWHLGTLTTTVRDSNRGGPKGAAHYAPPWEHGFDVCFSTEAKVPTWDPMVVPEGWRNRRAGNSFGTHYWSGPGRIVRDNLEGDDSRVIMDRALPFIRQAVKAGRPFLAVIWFHSPHLPTVAGRRYRELYRGRSLQEQHYWGCLTAMDEQVGRLRRELRRFGASTDTMLWYCSDNGPEGRERSARHPGSAGPLRGRKRSLREGGIRVPGLLEWPAVVRTPRVVRTPCVTSDYLPTILAALGREPEGGLEPLDGVDLGGVIAGTEHERSRPIAFQSGRQLALIDNRYKIYSPDDGGGYTLHDLVEDPGETRSLAAHRPKVLARMVKELERWRASCRRSRPV